MQFKYTIRSNKKKKMKNYWEWKVEFPDGTEYAKGISNNRLKEDIEEELTRTCNRLDVIYGYQKGQIDSMYG